MSHTSPLQIPVPDSLPASFEEPTVPSAPLRRRLNVKLHSHRLDDELSQGLDIDENPDRALRADQLTSASARSLLARSLREVVADAEHPGPAAISAAVPVCRDVVNIWRESLLEIAARLDVATRGDACGVARARALLSDGAGPLFNPKSSRLMGDALAWVAAGFASR
jgi:hypothetical protein